MLSNILHFNDDCLLLILDQLPLADLLKTNLICSRFKFLQPKACLARRSLTLVLCDKTSLGKQFVSSANRYTKRIKTYWTSHQNVHESSTAVWMSQSNWSCLQFNDLPIERVLRLVQVLPNIASLQICHYGTLSLVMEQIIYLMIRWTQNLVSFKFWRYGLEYASNNSKLLYRFVMCINAMPSLKILVIDIDDMFYPNLTNNTTASFDLSILSQLEYLYFFSKDPIDLLFGSLAKYGELNDNLKQVKVRNDIKDQIMLAKYSQLSLKLTSKITNFIIGSSSECVPAKLATLNFHFPSLTCLWLDIGNQSINRIAKYLSPLKHLTQLGLRIGQGSTLQLAPEMEQSKQQKDLHQLPTVRGIEMMIEAKTHTSQHQTQWDWIFPNLVALRCFNNSVQCSACEYDNFLRITSQDRLVCLQQLLHPFKKCLQLCLIQTYFLERRKWYKKQ